MLHMMTYIKNVLLLEIHFHIRLACIPFANKPNSGIQSVVKLEQVKSNNSLFCMKNIFLLT